ncbi:MAG: GWxTD domain-containing protein [Ignavibacteriales bacterium]|nr:GWxTD domain-containing protein [Ignavibacteriales bacterium]
MYKHGTMPETTASITDMQINESKYSVMLEEEVDRYFEYAKYIASDLERRQYQQLIDLRAKQKYLYEFWRKRSASSPSIVNDEAYYTRIKVANELFSSGFREGWKTDRGRIHVIYGPYDEIERYPSTSESNPYEIWHHNNIQGGVIFVFVDRDGLGNYLLVHSTHRNELHEDLWYERYALKMH